MTQQIRQEIRIERQPGFGSWRHSYTVEGPNGAVEFWVSVYDDKKHEPTAGLEFHYRVRPPHMKDHLPRVGCRALGGMSPCWHEGTSLYAHERLLPLWDSRRNETEMIEWIVPELSRLNKNIAPEEESR